MSWAQWLSQPALSCCLGVKNGACQKAVLSKGKLGGWTLAVSVACCPPCGKLMLMSRHPPNLNKNNRDVLCDGIVLRPKTSWIILDAINSTIIPWRFGVIWILHLWKLMWEHNSLRNPQKDPNLLVHGYVWCLLINNSIPHEHCIKLGHRPQCASTWRSTKWTLFPKRTAYVLILPAAPFLNPEWKDFSKPMWPVLNTSPLWGLNPYLLHIQQILYFRAITTTVGFTPCDDWVIC